MNNNIFFISFKDNYEQLINKLDTINTNEQLISQKREVSKLIINYLHSFGDVFERVGNKEGIDGILYGFYYLNNQAKHDKKLIELAIGVSNKTYPYSYPYTYGGTPHYIWNDFEDHETRKIRLRPFYDEHLVKKDVIKTVKSSYIAVADIIGNK